MVVNVAITEAYSILNYSSIVNRESVFLDLLIPDKNGLDIMVCDIRTPYLNAPFRKKIVFVAGLEHGLGEICKIMVIVTGLYGLNSIGAYLRTIIIGTCG